jgi:hypothetical protein
MQTEQTERIFNSNLLRSQLRAQTRLEATKETLTASLDKDNDKLNKNAIDKSFTPGLLGTGYADRFNALYDISGGDRDFAAQYAVTFYHAAVAMTIVTHHRDQSLPLYGVYKAAQEVVFAMDIVRVLKENPDEGMIKIITKASEEGLVNPVNILTYYLGLIARAYESLEKAS